MLGAFLWIASIVMSTAPSSTALEAVIPADLAGHRLDQALAALYPDYSRAQWQQWLKAGHLRVDGHAAKAATRVVGGEQLRGTLPVAPTLTAMPEAIPVEVIREDADFWVINKPPGLITHPGAGNPQGTLMNALLHFDPPLAQLPRAGLIHRLDKDTSGLLVVARHGASYQQLTAQMQARQIHRQYRALVQGELTGGGVIDAPLGRHPQDRLRQAVVESGRPAVTHYRIHRRFLGVTELLVELETGRTHQIRVHMAHIHHPVVGDPLYGSRRRLPPGLRDDQRDALNHYRRQALHAWRLQFPHPRTGDTLTAEAPLPTDLQQLLAILA